MKGIFCWLSLLRSKKNNSTKNNNRNNKRKKSLKRKRRKSDMNSNLYNINSKKINKMIKKIK